MKRKNIVMIIMILILVVASFFTVSYAGKNAISDNNSFSGPGTPPEMSSSSNSEGSSETQSSDLEKKGTPPAKPDSDSTNESSHSNSSEKGSNMPPAKPEDNNESGSSNSNNSDNENGSMQTPPSKPEDSNSENNTMPDLPGESNKNLGGEKNIDILYYLLFGTEALMISSLIIYLFMSSFNKKSLKETFIIVDKIIIYVLSTIILTSVLTFGYGYLAKTFFMGNNETTVSDNVEAKGVVTVDGNTKTLTDNYSSTKSDESSILVQNGGEATIEGATISKTGDSTNTENSEFYGINSGILVKKNSKAKISNANIKTSSKGSNAVFATGEGAEIEINDSTITTTGSSSARGLDATYGGTIKADNVTIKTEGGSCATLATDRGEGTVSVSNSSLETNGAGSPIIYSTGDISIENTKGTANGSQMTVIEGKNSATITSSTLKASGRGNRNNVDNSGVMIYQSMSGDASEGVGTFTSKNSTLEIDSSSDYYKTAPMFFITNTDAVINLENTKLIYGSNILVSIKGTDEWGKSGSNGGNLVLNASKQRLSGNINVDNISTMTLNLVKSEYYGTINGDNSAKELSLKLDKNSKITLTGDSYVSSLDDDDKTYSNIDFNGYKLYVNGKAIN